MKRLTPLLVLLAAPLLAQSGDCSVETGTSTTWEVVSSTATSALISYDYYNTSTKTFVFNFPIGTDLVVLGDEKCVFADGETERNDAERLTQEICDKPLAPENLIPDFPEVIGTDSDAPTVEDARQRKMHRQMIREIWSLPDTMLVSNCLLDLWQWVNTQGPTPHRRNWWDTTVQQDGEANSRFGGLTGAESILSQDAQYHGTELEDF